MRTEGGFSLLELLVVLFVVVIMVSLATLNTGSGAEERRLESTVRHLADVAAYARDEAIFSGRDFGLLLVLEQRDGVPATVVRWRERRIEGWRQPIRDGDVFQPLVFTDEVELELALDGVPVAIARVSRADGAVDGGANSDVNSGVNGAADGAVNRAVDEPQVIFYASGEATPGTLAWRQQRSGELLWIAGWDLLGNIEVSRDPLLASDV